MRSKNGFTLVELIVIITILTILGIISFITLQGYTKDARDAKRGSDIRNLYSKILLENQKGISFEELIESPKMYSRIINGEPIYSYNGTINFQILKENSDNFKDPLTGKDYEIAYSNDLFLHNYQNSIPAFVQLRTLMEKEYKEKYIGNYYKMTPKDSESLFGKKMTYGTLKISEAVSRYPGCDSYDITVSNGYESYTISSCNVGASKSNEYNLCTSKASCTRERVGDYFQWGNNYPFSSLGTINSTVGPINIEDLGAFEIGKYNSGVFIYNPNYPHRSIIGDMTKLWQEKAQGPCETGYHIPSKDEFSGLISLGNWETINEFSDSLKIPLSGVIAGNNSSPYSKAQGSHIYLSLSSENDRYVYGVYIAKDRFEIGPASLQVHGRPIRCFKD